MPLSGISLTIAVTVLAIMVALGGMAFGVGYAINSRALKEFGKEELNQCVINGALIGGMMLLFLPSGIVSSLIGTITSTSSAQCPSYLAANSAICFSYGYLSGSGYVFSGVSHPSILSQITTLITGLVSLNAALGLIGSLQISILGVGVSLSQAAAPLLYQLQFFIKVLSSAAISVLVQSSIISVVSVTSVSLLLPLGIILRTFYPTRKTGGFLLGLSIGLYVVLPLTYVLDASVINSYTVSFANSSLVTMTSSVSNLGSHMSSLSVRNASVLHAISSAFSPITSEFSLFADAILNYISYFLLAAFILPAFSLAITIVSIREISAVLGSEVSFDLLDLV